MKKLQNDYRRFRHNREQGKMQLTLLDYDIAKMELKNARAYRLAAYRRQQNKERNGMVALVCLPCLLCCQFLCCVLVLLRAYIPVVVFTIDIKHLQAFPAICTVNY